MSKQDEKLEPCLCGRIPRLVDVVGGWEILCDCGMSFCLDSPEKGPLVTLWDAMHNSHAALTERVAALEAEKRSSTIISTIRRMRDEWKAQGLIKWNKGGNDYLLISADAATAILKAIETEEVTHDGE